jgi:hypothetical protein
MPSRALNARSAASDRRNDRSGQHGFDPASTGLLDAVFPDVLVAGIQCAQYTARVQVLLGYTRTGMTMSIERSGHVAVKCALTRRVAASTSFAAGRDSLSLLGPDASN